MANRRELIAGLMSLGVAGCQAEKGPVTYREVFDAVLKLLRTRYYDQSHVERMQIAPFEAALPKVRNSIEMYYDVLQHLLRQLPSSHVAALPPTSAYGYVRQKTGGHKGVNVRALEHAVGLRFAHAHDGLWVTAIRRGSPAFRSGIEPGWRIMRYMVGSGADGAFVEAEFAPEGRPLRRHRWSVTPGEPPPFFTTQDLPEGPRLVSFEKFEPKQVDSVIAGLEDAGSRPVILDLRRNRGGLVSEELRLAGVLLPKGALLGVRQSARRKVKMVTPSSDVRFAGRLAVLVGRESSSAAEVLACALKDHGRARLFGGLTNGSVLVSQTFPLPDEGRLQLPTSNYRSARGARLEGVGVSPDVAVAETLESIATGRDAVVDAALAWLGRA